MLIFVISWFNHKSWNYAPIPMCILLHTGCGQLWCLLSTRRSELCNTKAQMQMEFEQLPGILAFHLSTFLSHLPHTRHSYVCMWSQFHNVASATVMKFKTMKINSGGLTWLVMNIQKLPTIQYILYHSPINSNSIHPPSICTLVSCWCFLNLRLRF